MTNNDLPSNSTKNTKPTEKTMQTNITTQAQHISTPNESVRRHVRFLSEEERISTEKWLSILNQVYDDWNYSPSQRIVYAVKFLNEGQKAWYEQNKDEIKDDWSSFCERLKQNSFNYKPIRPTTPLMNNSTLNNTEVVVLEDLVDAKFEKYSGVGDAKNWLLQTMNQFKACGLRREDQFDAIPLLLEGDAYLWYAENNDAILNFETFSKSFLQQFKSTTSSPTSSIGGTGTLVTTVPDYSSTSHLQRTVADEIIKKPTYFSGSKDDVHDWLDKLEQRFRMANWNDEQKLRYISIHLQDDPYRWWMQTSTSIKTWSSFITAIIQAFGSTRTQELALIQIQTIPRNTPLVIILLEIMHLPLNDTIIYKKIKQCLELIFKSENNLYGWGELIVELKPAIKYKLFNWPIKSTIYDIQRYFPQWYNWALSHCETGGLSSSHSRVVDIDVNVSSRTTINVLSKCTCHAKSPYRVGEKWGLQEALIYTGQMFLDKSMTRNHWSLSLDPDHSTLSRRKQNQMVSYAIYDCFATTYLAYPVLQYWTFQQVAKINIFILFQTSPSLSLHHEYNNIKNDIQVNKQLMKNIIVDGAVFISDDSDQSDEEIFINRCNDQFNNELLNRMIPDESNEDDTVLTVNNHYVVDDVSEEELEPVKKRRIHQQLPEELNEKEKLYDEQQLNDTVLIVNNHYVIDDVSEEELVSVKKRRTHQQRPEEYRKRKNKKRSAVQKKRRYNYSIRRKWYPRFPMAMIRKILKSYKINYTHVLDEGEELKIGVKDRASEQAAEHQLSASIFNRRSYFHYRKIFRC